MIVLTSTPNGLTLTKDARRMLVTDAAHLAAAIQALCVPTPAQLGSRLALSRRRFLEAA